jgi:hypothetical protein
MATNKCYERLATLELGVPQSGGANIAILSGAPVLFGTTVTAGKPMAGVACEATTASPASNPQDANVPFFTVDFEGVYNLTCSATTLESPSAGAAINPGDIVYYTEGTYDKNTGVTYGGYLTVDTTGVPFGRSMDALAAGLTGVLRIILANVGR